MFRKIDIALMLLMVAGATFTYKVKHQAELKLEEVHRLEAEIKLQEDTIDLLKADWALLNQPSRLQKLITVYQPELQLETTQPSQIATLDELPDRPVAPPDAPLVSEGQPAGAASAMPDQTKTGSVVR